MLNIIKNFVNEWRINWHSKRMSRDKTQSKARHHFYLMVYYINKRDPIQIKRMEDKKGLL